MEFNSKFVLPWKNPTAAFQDKESDRIALTNSTQSQLRPLTNSISLGVPHYTEQVIQDRYVQYLESSTQQIPNQYRASMYNPQFQSSMTTSGGVPLLPFPSQFPPAMFSQRPPPYLVSPYHTMLYSIPPPSPPQTHMQSQQVPLPLAIPKLASSGQTQVIFRNLFHTLTCLLNGDETNWEGCRVYVSDSVGYSGNAKRFKKRADGTEKALSLDCVLLGANNQPASQCLQCKDYFETQKYFKANPECVGRIVLIKNNTPIQIENGQFKILIKMMCCCAHHNVDFFPFQVNLFDGKDGTHVVYSAVTPINIKQWRKSSQKKDDCSITLDAKM